MYINIYINLELSRYHESIEAQETLQFVILFLNKSKNLFGRDKLTCSSDFRKLYLVMN